MAKAMMGDTMQLWEPREGSDLPGRGEEALGEESVLNLKDHRKLTRGREQRVLLAEQLVLLETP